MGAGFDDSASVVAQFPHHIRCATTANAAPHIGYARDRDGPRLARLIERRRAAGCDQVFSDAAHGAAMFRPGLDAAIAALAPGRLLAVDSLALLTWREDELRKILFAVESAGAHILADAEAFDTRRESDIFSLARSLDAFASSVRAARMAETAMLRADRRSKIEPAAWRQMRAKIDSGEVTVAAAAVALGVKRSTIYRRMEA